MSLPMVGGAPAAPQDVTVDAELKQRLDELVQNNDLVLFMKGTPEQPQCGFSARAAQVYQGTGQPFQAINVLEQGDNPMAFIRAVGVWADWPTLPQCWVKGELIGGSDVAVELYESGELFEMLGIERPAAE